MHEEIRLEPLQCYRSLFPYAHSLTKFSSRDWEGTKQGLWNSFSLLHRDIYSTVTLDVSGHVVSLPFLEFGQLRGELSKAVPCWCCYLHVRSFLLYEGDHMHRGISLLFLTDKRPGNKVVRIVGALLIPFPLFRMHPVECRNPFQASCGPSEVGRTKRLWRFW